MNMVELPDLRGALRQKGDRCFLDIEVKPGSSKSGFTGFDDWRKRFIVNVRAPALKGRANREVVEIVSKVLGAREVVIESGHAGRSKTVSFKLTDTNDVLERLGTLIS